MNIEEAIRILDPETSVEALIEIEYYGGFNGDKAKLEAVNEACRMAVEALHTQQERKKPKPMTNGDRIRAMNDKELGIFLGDWAANSLSWKEDGEGEVLGWLQDPAKENEKYF